MVNVSDRFNRGLNNSGYDTDCVKRFVEVTLIDAIQSGLKDRSVERYNRTCADG